MYLHEMSAVNNARSISKSDLAALETYMNNLLRPHNCSFRFSYHFIDRTYDDRNKGQPITVNQMTAALASSARRLGKLFASLTDDEHVVVFDSNTKLNVPFVKNINKRTGTHEIVAKTIMRSDYFKTTQRRVRI